MFDRNDIQTVFFTLYVLISTLKVNQYKISFNFPTSRNSVKFHKQIGDGYSSPCSLKYEKAVSYSGGRNDKYVRT